MWMGETKASPMTFKDFGRVWLTEMISKIDIDREFRCEVGEVRTLELFVNLPQRHALAGAVVSKHYETVACKNSVSERSNRQFAITSLDQIERHIFDCGFRASGRRIAYATEWVVLAEVQVRGGVDELALKLRERHCVDK